MCQRGMDGRGVIDPVFPGQAIVFLPAHLHGGIRMETRPQNSTAHLLFTPLSARNPAEFFCSSHGLMSAACKEDMTPVVTQEDELVRFGEDTA